MILGALVFFDVLPTIGDWEQKEVANGLNNFIICIEMFILSIIHHFVFPYQEYVSNDSLDERKIDPRRALTAVKNFKDVINQNDMLSDFKTAYSPKRMKRAREVQKVLNSVDFHTTSSSDSFDGTL